MLPALPFTDPVHRRLAASARGAAACAQTRATRPSPISWPCSSPATASRSGLRSARTRGWAERITVLIWSSVGCSGAVGLRSGAGAGFGCGPARVTGGRSRKSRCRVDMGEKPPVNLGETPHWVSTPRPGGRSGAFLRAPPSPTYGPCPTRLARRPSLLGSRRSRRAQPDRPARGLMDQARPARDGPALLRGGAAGPSRRLLRSGAGGRHRPTLDRVWKGRLPGVPRPWVRFWVGRLVSAYRMLSRARRRPGDNRL